MVPSGEQRLSDGAFAGGSIFQYALAVRAGQLDLAQVAFHRIVFVLIGDRGGQLATRALSRSLHQICELLLALEQLTATLVEQGTIILPEFSRTARRGLEIMSGAGGQRYGKGDEPDSRMGEDRHGGVDTGQFWQKPDAVVACTRLDVVRTEGLEPSRGYPQRILSDLPPMLEN